jgi:Outer membrane protein beta-barrel domain
MKRVLLTAFAVVGWCATMQAQDADTIKPSSKTDTIKIGAITIIKRHDERNRRDRDDDTRIVITRRRRNLSNISTNWGILDIGFSNFTEKSDFAAATASGFLSNRPGATPLGKSDFRLRGGKSINVNFWLFMQKLNVIKHVVNLKYGLGVELNNYRYKSNISYLDEPVTRIIRDSISFSKNKLAADYITVPLMLNINASPRQRNSLSISAGVSAGYLYSARNKQISGDRGKEKNRSDYNLDKWKLSWIGEIGLGQVRLYGSYSMNALHEDGLTQYPYNIGIRLSNW